MNKNPSSGKKQQSRNVRNFKEQDNIGSYHARLMDFSEEDRRRLATLKAKKNKSSSDYHEMSVLRESMVNATNSAKRFRPVIPNPNDTVPEKWSHSYKSHMPANHFAYSDGSGNCSLPIFDAAGNLSVTHLRNAIARLKLTKLPSESVRKELDKKLHDLLSRHKSGETITADMWDPVTRRMKKNPEHVEYIYDPIGDISPIEGRYVVISGKKITLRQLVNYWINGGIGE